MKTLRFLHFALALLLLCTARAADVQISDFTATTSPASTDLLHMQIDVSGTWRDRKITLGNFKTSLGLPTSDPNADRLLFWDDSAGGLTYLTLGTGLSITGTTINAESGGGDVAADADNVFTGANTFQDVPTVSMSGDTPPQLLLTRGVTAKSRLMAMKSLEATQPLWTGFAMTVNADYDATLGTYVYDDEAQTIMVLANEYQWYNPTDRWYQSELNWQANGRRVLNLWTRTQSEVTTVSSGSGVGGVTVTTADNHNFSIGTSVYLSVAGTSPALAGSFTVVATPSAKTFTITPATAITGVSTAAQRGTVRATSGNTTVSVASFQVLSPFSVSVPEYDTTDTAEKKIALFEGYSSSTAVPVTMRLQNSNSGNSASSVCLQMKGFGNTGGTWWDISAGYDASSGAYVHGLEIANRLGGGYGIRIRPKSGAASTTQFAINKETPAKELDVVGDGAFTGTLTAGTFSGSGASLTGIPVSGITASTSTSLGVGSVELGHATDTTLARLGAGRLGVEGVEALTQTNTVTGITNKTFVAPVLGAFTATSGAFGGATLGTYAAAVTGGILNSSLFSTNPGGLQFKFRSDAYVVWLNGTDLTFSSPDTNLYRSAADTLKTDDSFVVGAGFSVLGATTLGTGGTAITSLRHGTATLSGGTTGAVSATWITTSTRFVVTGQTQTNVGHLSVAIVNGTSYQIDSSNASDARVVTWQAIVP